MAKWLNDSILAGVALLWSILCASAAAQTLSPQQQLTHDVFKELIEIKTTNSGVGTTPAAEAVARRLLAAGFPQADVQVIGPNDKKKNLVVRLRGRGHGKPILLIAHLDVVEANREDWSPEFDPFKFTEKDGYFYGRGTQDIKEGAAIFVANFIKWKQTGWVPERDIILALTADEEIAGDNGVDWLLKNRRELIDAEFCLNPDSGDFRSEAGKPVAANISAGEKKYAALELSATNKGGHGSLPRPDNAIYDLADALERVRKLQFPVMLSEVTSAQLGTLADSETPQMKSDLKALLGGSKDAAIADRVSQNPYYNALIRTTCIPTKLAGGHSENALPQHAIAVLNCRILPGHASDDVLRAVQQAVANPQVGVKWTYINADEAPAPKFQPEVFNAIRKAVQAQWPGVPVTPSMDTGASDGKYLRGVGMPVYGVVGVFIDGDDVRAHGRDERLRAKDFYDGVEFYEKLIRNLTEE